MSGDLTGLCLYITNIMTTGLHYERGKKDGKGYYLHVVPAGKSSS